MTDCVDCGKRGMWRCKDGKTRCDDCNAKFSNVKCPRCKKGHLYGTKNPNVLKACGLCSYKERKR